MGGEGCEGKYCNFPYRKSFTPDLNVFLYTKVSISSFTSFTTSFIKIHNCISFTSNPRQLIIPNWGILYLLTLQGDVKS